MGSPVSDTQSFEEESFTLEIPKRGARELPNARYRVDVYPLRHGVVDLHLWKLWAHRIRDE